MKTKWHLNINLIRVLILILFIFHFKKNLMSKFKSYFIIGYNFLHTKMLRDYVNEIKELQNGRVYIKNKNVVNQLISELIQGGPNKLQVVSDFDRTITKQYEHGKEYVSSFGKCNLLTLFIRFF